MKTSSFILYGTMVILIFGLMFVPTFQSGYGLISGESEYFDQRPELYKIGARVMEFVEGHNPTLCTSPEIKIEDTDILKNPTINQDNVDNHIFVVLNESELDSYRYLKMTLPEGKGYHNYRNFVYDQNGQYVTGNAMGIESGSARFVYETVSKNTIIDEDKRFEEFREGDSKFEAYSYPIKPGEYNFHSVLYQFYGQSIEKKPCVYILDWDFVVNDDGTFSTKTPQVKTGTLVNITLQFSPKEQTKLGFESWSITCKEGQSVLSQKKHFFYESRFACVTPETKTKLIERGWNLAAPASELTYFEKSKELEIGQKFENFMKKQSYNNVPSAFVIGKHNFKNNGDITYFCGEFKEITVNYHHYFHGAIDSSGTLVWDGISKQSAWCAINDDAHQFSFVYDWEIKNEK